MVARNKIWVQNEKKKNQLYTVKILKGATFF